MGSKPSFRNRAASSVSVAFGVVNNLSPINTEFAPAKKQSACPSSVMEDRPAERRMSDLGIKIRAVATARTIWSQGKGGFSASGVPGIGTNALMGTDSGGGV